MGAYTEIVDFTFTANETSRTFSGLSITKDDFICIESTVVNPVSNTSQIRLFPNTTAGVSGFDTQTNYHFQFIGGFGSTAAAGRQNQNIINEIPSNKTGYSNAYFKISENGKSNTFANYTQTTDSSIVNIFLYTTSSNLTFNDPITSLTFTASQTNGIGTGSRIQIYKLAAEKVADITVASNTTQVDILNLSIDKDSEYLLVYDFPKVSTSATINLTPNDLTTVSGYHRQVIEGAGTGATASRANNAGMTFLSSADANRSNGYAHIKLSNIGAYTHQSYSNRDQGTANIRLQNFFASSTAENITSITKLNIRADATNQIISGARFILYKLYE